jgi:hypothetical protein
MLLSSEQESSKTWTDEITLQTNRIASLWLSIRVGFAEIFSGCF